MKTMMDEPEEPDISMSAMEAVEAQIKDVRARQAESMQAFAQVMKSLETEDTKPPGYGVLGVTYEWRNYAPTGMRDSVRAWCITDKRWMTTTLKVDPRYGQKESKHTRGINSVIYKGHPVLCWECRTCGQWVIQ